MVLGQKVEFKKNFGPNLGALEIDKLLEIKEEEFTKNLSPIYELLVDLKRSEDLKKKRHNWFCGSSMDTYLVYMINKVSPKNGTSK